MATDDFLQAGIDAFGQLPFQGPPRADQLTVTDVEILLDREDCLVVYAVVRSENPESEAAGVDVLWPHEDHGWRFVSSWENKVDLWMDDCDLRERS